MHYWPQVSPDELAKWIVDEPLPMSILEGAVTLKGAALMFSELPCVANVPPARISLVVELIASGFCSAKIPC